MHIILIRHAKSSWETQEEDHNRPLASRGISDANLVFATLNNWLPNTYEIWSSTATRATETAKIFLKYVNGTPKNTSFQKELYTFDVSKLEAIIAKNKTKNIVIFGHNPAITDFVNKYGNYQVENVPTCGVVSLFFENHFTINQKGIIEHFIVPKRLK